MDLKQGPESYCQIFHLQKKPNLYISLLYTVALSVLRNKTLDSSKCTRYTLPTMTILFSRLQKGFISKSMLRKTHLDTCQIVRSSFSYRFRTFQSVIYCKNYGWVWSSVSFAIFFQTSRRLHPQMPSGCVFYNFSLPSNSKDRSIIYGGCRKISAYVTHVCLYISKFITMFVSSPLPDKFFLFESSRCLFGVVFLLNFKS